MKRGRKKEEKHSEETEKTKKNLTIKKKQIGS